MELLYWIVVKFYGFLIRVASLFNRKAKLWVEGRRSLLSGLQNRFTDDNERRIWFHCSSLGEFEQGKPVLDRLRKEYPDYKIVLTFFSPSGYQLKKNDPAADYVLYLPLDGPNNSSHFIDKVKPVFAVFVKYEFWHFYIKYLREKKIPCFVVSANFRPSQIYFRWYGRFFYKILQRITHIFVQNQASLELLYKKTLTNVTVSGDTRFDRVYIISRNPKTFADVEKFIGGSNVFIAGSTWSPDEKLIIQLANEWKANWKFIIAPHEINHRNLQNIMSRLTVKSVLYSEINKLTPDMEVLIIDTVGMLSSLYSYGTIAYIGGGFGAGIHNTLEPAAFGLPVLFGPNYRKFAEANRMVKDNTAFSVNSYEELLSRVTMLTENDKALSVIKEHSLKFIENNRGASDIFINYLKMNYPAEVHYSEEKH